MFRTRQLNLFVQRFPQCKIINAPCGKRDRHIYCKKCAISRHYRFVNIPTVFYHLQGGVQQGNVQ